MACWSWGKAQTKLSVKPELFKYKTDFPKAWNPNFSKPLLVAGCLFTLIFRFKLISKIVYFFGFSNIQFLLFLIFHDFHFSKIWQTRNSIISDVKYKLFFNFLFIIFLRFSFTNNLANTKLNNFWCKTKIILRFSFPNHLQTQNSTISDEKYK